jgi:hypothetical protein
MLELIDRLAHRRGDGTGTIRRPASSIRVGRAERAYAAPRRDPSDFVIDRTPGIA